METFLPQNWSLVLKRLGTVGLRRQSVGPLLAFAPPSSPPLGAGRAEGGGR